jgi:hypothetical protein
LLDWLESRLGLAWQHGAQAAAPLPAASAVAMPAVRSYPDPAALAALEQGVTLGYYRGILNTLDEIERTQPGHADFVQSMRRLAGQFQFDTMSQILQQARHVTRPA